MDVEDALDQAAEYLGVDREDEWTFDSDDFPKHTPVSMLRTGRREGEDHADYCDRCLEPFIE